MEYREEHLRLILFFEISNYYLYGQSTSNVCKRILKMVHILKSNIKVFIYLVDLNLKT